MGDASDASPVAPARSQPMAGFSRWLAPYRGKMLLILLALLVAGCAELGIGLAIKGIVDRAFEARVGTLARYFLPMFGVVAVYALATFFRLWIVTWLGERVVADLRKAVYGHLLSLSPAFFETTKVGELLSRLVADTSVIQTTIASTIPATLRSLMLLVGGAALMIVSSTKLAAVVLLLLPLLILPAVPFGRWVRSLSRTAQDKLAEVNVLANETIHAIQTVQAFTHETQDRTRFASATEETFRAARRRVVGQSLFAATIILLIFGLVNGVLWLGTRDVLLGKITAGELTAFVFYAVLMAGALGQLGGTWGQMQLASGAAERMLELLDVQSEIRSPASPLPLPDRHRIDIRFADVTFHYPSRPATTSLGNLSLEIPAGETVALVGPSGAGKSTIFRLLLRFYDPQEGAICLNDIDLKSLELHELRSVIGYVSQDPDIFSGSVAENIRYGRPDASDQEVHEAARMAAAVEFIEHLPEGFDTELGERGVRLSGGQRQRIAIARCVLRDAPIVLFDEATSALDSASERLVQQAIASLAADRTTLVIAHRLATVQRAERIVVLDRGRIVAEGTHDELVGSDGLYAELVKMQFQIDGATP